MQATETFCHYSHMLCPYLPRASALRIFQDLSRSPGLAAIGAAMPAGMAADPDVAWMWMTSNLSRAQLGELQDTFPGRIRDNWEGVGLLLLLLAAALLFAYKALGVIYWLIEKATGR